MIYDLALHNLVNGICILSIVIAIYMTYHIVKGDDHESRSQD